MGDVAFGEPDGRFDFKAHEQAAIADYLERFPFFQQFAAVMKQIVEAAIAHRAIKVHSVQARAKDPSSFGVKASLPSDDDPRKPRYRHPSKRSRTLPEFGLSPSFLALSMKSTSYCERSSQS